MKKLFSKLFIVGALGGLTLLASCGGDDDEPTPAGPSIVVTTSPSADANGVINLEAGEELIISVNASTPGGFNTATLSGAVTVTETRTTLGIDAGATSADFSFDPIVFNEGGSATITVTVVDDIIVDGVSQTAEETLTIEVAEPAVEDATIYTAFLLAAPLGDGSSDTFFSTSNGLKYSDDDVIASTAALSANIDFGYYYGATNKASLAGIEAYPTNVVDVDAWNKQNVTLFRTSTMTAAEFDAVTEFDGDDIAAEFEVGTAEAGQKNNLAAGTVLAFKTDATKTGGSKFGLLKVVSITGTTEVNDGINVEIKVQM